MDVKVQHDGSYYSLNQQKLLRNTQSEAGPGGLIQQQTEYSNNIRMM